MTEEDVDTISFDGSPTDDLGARLRQDPGRRREETPVYPRGTPRPGIAPPEPSPSPSPSSSFDELTVEREPLAVGLIEENAPLDRDPNERALLAAIASGDEPSRMIYADWLEERTEQARAAFLRIEQLVAKLSPADPRFEGCSRQLRELAQHIDPDWRARVARPPIEGCPAFDFQCPQRWDALARTDREEVRSCSSCVKYVYYYESVDDAREAARAGHCVAIDLGSERWEDDLVDLGTRCAGGSRRIVSRARFCPHCGHEITRVVRMGMMRIDD
jgi:uncharacterized protein (TIGR02996 family)